MISKQECYKILLEMRNEGNNVNEYLNILAGKPKVPSEVIKFINENRNLEVTAFYEKLRSKYNKKRSKLYKTLVDEGNPPENYVKTLSSFITQALIAGESLDDVKRIGFYRSLKLKECAASLYGYFEDQDLTALINLVRLIKTDIKILEEKREKEMTLNGVIQEVNE